MSNFSVSAAWHWNRQRVEKKIRYYYNRHLNEMCDNGLKAGDHMTIAREKLVEFIVNAVDDINNSNIDSGYISKLFRQCGLDPWSTDQSDFTTHLDKLSRDSVYKSLSEAHESLNLL